MQLLSILEWPMVFKHFFSTLQIQRNEVLTKHSDKTCNYIGIFTLNDQLLLDTSRGPKKGSQQHTALFWCLTTTMHTQMVLMFSCIWAKRVEIFCKHWFLGKCWVYKKCTVLFYLSFIITGLHTEYDLS